MRTDQEKVIAELAATFRPRWRERAKHFTFRWVLGSKSNQTYLESLMARITTEQRIPITVNPLTEAQRPARIDGEVEFASSDEAVATVTKTGPNSALVTSVGAGVAQISASFDADLSGEVRPVEMTGAVEVVEAEAVTAEITFGTPELKPVA